MSNRTVVVLPDPLGPTKPKMVPLSMARLRSLTPSPESKIFETSRITTMGVVAFDVWVTRHAFPADATWYPDLADPKPPRSAGLSFSLDGYLSVTWRKETQ